MSESTSIYCRNELVNEIGIPISITLRIGRDVARTNSLGTGPFEKRWNDMAASEHRSRINKTEGLLYMDRRKR
jgi:hypothetical protein